MDIKAASQKAVELAKKGDLGSAEKIYASIINHDRTIPEAWHNLGLALHGQGKFKEASIALINALRAYKEREKSQKRTYDVHGYISKETDEKNVRMMMEEKSGNFGAFGKVFSKYFEPFIKNGDSILEVGTGVGLICEFIQEKFEIPIYYSFEQDEELVGYLRRKFPSLIHMPCDGSTLAGIADESIDVVLAYGLFTYISDYSRYKYFEEMARVTKNGGKIIFDIFDCDDCDDYIFDFIKKKQSNLDGRPYLSARFIDKYFNRMGFSCVSKHRDTGGDSYKPCFMTFQKLQ